MAKAKREKLTPKADRKPINLMGVSKGSLTTTSPCWVVANCKHQAEYFVFGGMGAGVDFDGKPKMSRLSYCSCKHHLELAIKRVLNWTRHEPAYDRSWPVRERRTFCIIDYTPVEARAQARVATGTARSPRRPPRGITF